jgi:hypothetical protein
VLERRKAHNRVIRLAVVESERHQAQEVDALQLQRTLSLESGFVRASGTRTYAVSGFYEDVEREIAADRLKGMVLLLNILCGVRRSTTVRVSILEQTRYKALSGN